MTDQITVPKQTWDALINALENHAGNYKLTKSECAAMAEVITAANAVSEQPLKITDLGRYALEPQAQTNGYLKAFLSYSGLKHQAHEVAAHIAASVPIDAEPAGWKLVPVEPTPEMCDAARWSEYGEETSRQYEVSNEFIQSVWALLLAAAPEAK